MATRTVQRISNAATPAWATILWGLALVSLLLLPSNYRAGSEIAHGHSLLQLWVDAADGQVDHHHVAGDARAGPELVTDWLDPHVGGAPSFSADERPDLPGHHDSVPLGGVHFVVTAIALVLIVAVSRAPAIDLARVLAGRTPSVPFPPPRWTASPA